MITLDTRKSYDTRHGGAFDRGSADSYYGRPRIPHMFAEGSYTSLQIHQAEMTPAEIQAYHAGYSWNEQFGDKKDWG